MCFLYGAHIMYGASKFAAPGGVTNVRNSFSAGGAASRDAHVFYVRSTHNVRGEHMCHADSSGHCVFLHCFACVAFDRDIFDV